MPSRRLFITFEVLKTNDIDFRIIYHIDDSRGPAFIEVYAGDRRRYLDPDRRHTHPNDLTFLHKQVWSKLGSVEAEFLENGNNCLCVAGVYGDPDIHVGGCARVAMIGHRIAADEQILNAMRVE